MVEDARFNHVGASMQLTGNVCGSDLFPIAIRRKRNRGAIDLHFGTSHCTNAQMRRGRSVHQSKLAPKGCVEAGKPMRMRVNRRGKHDPFRPFIASQKIDRRIGPRDPSQNGHRDDRNRAD